MPALPFPSALDDGTPVLVRPVVPSDRGLFVAGAAEASDETLQHRFMAPIRTLSAAQLDYFTQVDQQRHVAWGALEQGPEERGLGVGRWVALESRSGLAEVSLAAVDRAQGRGLGTLLLAVLVVRARQEGLSGLAAYVSTDNPRAAGWFRRIGAQAQPHDAFEGADTLVLALDAETPSTPARRRLDARIAEVERAFGTGP